MFQKQSRKTQHYLGAISIFKLLFPKLTIFQSIIARNTVFVFLHYNVHTNSAEQTISIYGPHELVDSLIVQQLPVFQVLLIAKKIRKDLL